MNIPKPSSTPSLVFNLLVAAASLFLLSQHFIKIEKVAYVDSSKLLNQYKGAANAQKGYDAKTKIWQSNIDTLTLGVQNAIKEYEKEMGGMSAREQQMAKQLIGTKQQELSDYQRAIRENARQEDVKLTQGIVSQINAFLIQYGKKHNYKLILIANQAGTIAYAREGLDITEDVVRDLNQEYEGN